MNNCQKLACHIFVIDDEKYRQTISLEEEIYSIGRNPKSNIVIHSAHASRHHGTLMRRKNRLNNDYHYWIIDGDLEGNKSRNGIYINGEKCLVKELKNGDLINFGCEVNATYYALHEWSDTIVDIKKVKTTQQDEKSTINTKSFIKISEPSLELPTTNIINSKETLKAREYQDPLTQLPNRILFEEYLGNSIQNAHQSNTLMAIILLNINHFKTLYKNWGSLVIDQILIAVAKRLNASLRASDIVARWGEDEFALLLSKISHYDDLDKITERLLTNINQPIIISNHQLYLDYSLGCAVCPQEGQDAKTLLKTTQVALLNNKKQAISLGTSPNLIIDPKASKLLKAKTILRQALENNEFVLYYQPQIKIKTGEISGIEALVRWNHPNLGQILPQKFIPLAEQTDLIFEIGKWILKTACHQNKVWQDSGLPPFIMSVNLSPQQLENPNLVSIVKQVLEETNLAPHWLELELTEKALLANPDTVHQTLQNLQKLGIHLSMDDFGSGYSCLNNLAKFTFATLKIAQSCIKQLTDTSENLAVISAAIALGNSLDIRVVAEGVETQKQLELLENLNCQEMQGYLLSQPLKLEEATNFLSLYYGRVIPC